VQFEAILDVEHFWQFGAARPHIGQVP